MAHACEPANAQPRAAFENPAAPSEPARLKLGGPALVTILALGLSWTLFVLKIRLNWDPESYYGFGWFVPPLAGLFAWFRWRDGLSAQPRLASPGALAAASLLLLAHGVFRLGVELNPFWRLPLWGAGATLIGATWLSVLGLWGRRVGADLAIPALFLLTMIPWPASVEQRVIAAMTEGVVAANVAALQVLGYPATAEGNVIVIGASTVGVDEACSGIRSLQTLGMLALAVGEFWRLTAWRRVALIGVAALAALVFNFGRALTLALCVHHGGLAVYERWHDPLGYLSIAGSATCLLAVAYRWSDGRSKKPSRAKSRVDDPQVQTSLHPAAARRGLFAAAGLLATCAAVSASAAQWWFRADEAKAGRFDFALHWPAGGGLRATPLEIEPRVREILGFDYGDRRLLRSDAGASLEAWCYGFDGGSGSKSLSAYVHSPAVCMTASGATLTARRPQLEVDLGPFALPFEHYTFRSAARFGGAPVQVFWCMWDAADADANERNFRSAQLTALVQRQRRLERKVLLLAIPGGRAAEAREQLTSAVRAFVVPVVDGVERRLP